MQHSAEVLLPCSQPSGQVQQLYASMSAAPHCCALLCRPFTKADGCRADGWWHPYLKEVRHTVVILQGLSLSVVHQLASR